MGVGTIYTASVALWLFGIYFPGIELARRAYLGTIGTPADVATWAYFVAFALALLSTYLGLKSIRSQRKARQNRMRKLAATAVERLSFIELCGAAKDVQFIGTCAELAGIDPDTVQGRAHFYGTLDGEALMHYMPMEPKPLARSHFVALLTDLPPRWILDCATNRREAAKATRVSKDAV
jgi:hypothetical protein